MAKKRVVLDPGIGFGKTLEHNWALMQGLDKLLTLGQPLLIGWSRKSMVGAITGRAEEDRLAASVAAALASVQRGARVVRVHDVAATVDALAVWRRSGSSSSRESDTTRHRHTEGDRWHDATSAPTAFAAR